MNAARLQCDCGPVHWVAGLSKTGGGGEAFPHSSLIDSVCHSPSIGWCPDQFVSVYEALRKKSLNNEALVFHFLVN